MSELGHVSRMGQKLSNTLLIFQQMSQSGTQPCHPVLTKMVSRVCSHEATACFTSVAAEIDCQPHA